LVYTELFMPAGFTIKDDTGREFILLHVKTVAKMIHVL